MNILFHILNTNNSQQAWLFVCNMLEKFYLENRRIYLALDTRLEAERFDQLLWTYRDDSFIPHSLLEHADINTPIIIGYDNLNIDSPRDLLINLSQHIPAHYQDFQQFIEIVINDSEIQQRARERYKHYRDQQHHINTIKQ